MIFTLIQLATTSLVAAYLAWSDFALHRRNRRSWESIVARLRPDPDAGGAAGRDFWGDRPHTPSGKPAHQRASRQSLWIQFVNAGVLQEMADFAGRNSNSVDETLLDNLHRDAGYIRIRALIALLICFFAGPAGTSA